MNAHTSFPEPFSVERIMLRLRELGGFKTPEILNIGYGKGAFSGYSEYRYKPQPLKIACKSHTPIFDAAARARLVATTAQNLQQWTFSKFQFEADCVNGLRSHLCIRGHDWEEAHDEAREIVDDALNVIRAVRPTWAQGQREATVSPDHCQWCAGALPEDYRKRKQMFCSVDCAKSALANRKFDKGAWKHPVGMAAIRKVKEELLPYLACEQCNRGFQPGFNQPGQRFCSYVCSNLSRRLRENSTCKQCGTEFYKRAGYYRDLCSDKCKAEYGALPKFKCWTCRNDFASGAKQPHFCGKSCRERWGTARREDRLRACLCCDEVFPATKRSDGFCSGLCRTKAKVRQALSLCVVGRPQRLFSCR